MKAWTYLLLLFTMITSCSSHSESQKLTWYNNATINNILEDPDKPEEVVRVAIGISAQVFYLSKKSSDYKVLMEKVNLSFKKGNIYNIGVESNTNIIKQIKEVK
ncbi:hypothetical protein EG359_22045 [Chryseobacterium joostei]|uniref:DUF4136 domain-containing protein n=1 Tax=Chryseobacterium joostei TaxID=112234 RepID=A0A1N7IE39_9FLAO|nr:MULTISPECIES: hypothetical protein [Chryseobacterium]AZB02109.1 hypothetical protein EG359_22045 [Chryseobacterium joostei]SIS35336.1 hypothetical protein SAMN05421768_104322 [Chryseobacterium joostei]HCM36015.1 hypothetical protein [Chryseobacterium sp.]